MLTLGILQCDQVPRGMSHTFADYPSLLQDWLTASCPRVRFYCYDVRKMQYPNRIDDCDGYITTGSHHSVYEAIPWIHTLERFVQKLYQHNTPYVGICFGHQMLAKALGGTVARSDKGWGVGVSQNSIVHTASWMQPTQQCLNLIVSHQDQIMQLPEDTQVLAQSPFCPYYMIQSGSSMLGIQGHPEFSKTYSRALMQLRCERIGKDTITAGMASLHHPIQPDIIGEWVIQFIAAHR